MKAGRFGALLSLIRARIAGADPFRIIGIFGFRLIYT